MINKGVYNRELIQTLDGDLYVGDKEFADLRFIFNDIIKSIKYTSYVEENCQHMVQLTNVDEVFVKRQINLYFEHTKKYIEKYSKDDIISSIIDNIDLINYIISRDLKKIADVYKIMGQEPKFMCELISVDELKHKLKLG